MCVHPAAAECIKAFGAPIIWQNDPFSDAASALYRELLALAEQVAAGTLRAESLEVRMMMALESGHIAAHAAGQEMSGFPVSQTLAARRGSLVAQAQNSYVRGLVTALIEQDPRYWDTEAREWREEPLRARMGSYVGRTRGTANDGWVSAAPAFTLYTWNLGAVEMHCSECPVLAADSPYLASADTGQLQYPTLYTKPGECDTPCLFNCTCTLSRASDGATGPQPFRFQD